MYRSEAEIANPIRQINGLPAHSARVPKPVRIQRIVEDAIDPTQELGQ
jgi:hypothetical protein